MTKGSTAFRRPVPAAGCAPSSLCAAASMAACSTSGESRLGARRATSARVTSAAGPLEPTRCVTSLPAASRRQAGIEAHSSNAQVKGRDRVRAPLMGAEAGLAPASWQPQWPGRITWDRRPPAGKCIAPTRDSVLKGAAKCGQRGQALEDVVVLLIQQLLQACRGVTQADRQRRQGSDEERQALPARMPGC